eukprot:6260117-Prorocentrum_lima.AAC.1
MFFTIRLRAKHVFLVSLSIEFAVKLLQQLRESIDDPLVDRCNVDTIISYIYDQDVVQSRIQQCKLVDLGPTHPRGGAGRAAILDGDLVEQRNSDR